MAQQAIVTGSAGLIGSQLVESLCAEGYQVIGIDNSMRGYFFGQESSTNNRAQQLMQKFGPDYTHVEADIRSESEMAAVSREVSGDLFAVFHAAA